VQLFWEMIGRDPLQDSPRASIEQHVLVGDGPRRLQA
jgi:hypothetical protein